MIRRDKMGHPRLALDAVGSIYAGTEDGSRVLASSRALKWSENWLMTANGWSLATIVGLTVTDVRQQWS